MEPLINEELPVEKCYDHTFDKGLEFNEIKTDLLRDYIQRYDDAYRCDFDKISQYDKRTIVGKVVYILIALLQLKNGCRVSESVEAFLQFMKERKFNQRISIKIAKSRKKKTKVVDGEEQVDYTKTRYRPIEFIPGEWLAPCDVRKDEHMLSIISNYLKELKNVSCLKQRVLDYLSTYHKCNTHSLRFALINHLLVDQKQPESVVAKFVGHASTAQIYTYTQKLSADKIFDIKL